MNSAYELFVHGLREMLNAETRLVHVLGEQARETKRAALNDAFDLHRKETEQHAVRIMDIFRKIGEVPEQGDCKAVEGLVEEKKLLMKQSPSRELLDFINVGAGIKAERYEISAYESLLMLAHQLGIQVAISGLSQTLQEEKNALQKLETLLPEVKPTTLGVTAEGFNKVPEGGEPTAA